MNIFAEIEGINYTPLVCRFLEEYNLSNLEDAFRKNATFILNFDKNNKFAISWWVSPKRTRSYPYARVYDSLAFQGKRVTVIPVLKDEGKDGDRDFIQWDTISLMSLLGVYVILSYYKEAQKNLKFRDLAEKAQVRESKTAQPKEKVEGQKVQITIKNYLGGYYFFTCDEVIIQNDLIECKHSKRSILPSKADIKDGLVKMILYTNLRNLRINDEKFQHRSILKLTTLQNFDIEKLKKLDFLRQLQRESRQNSFSVLINDFKLENFI